MERIGMGIFLWTHLLDSVINNRRMLFLWLQLEPEKNLRCDGALLEVIPRLNLSWEPKLQMSCSLPHACGMEVTRTDTCALPLNSPAEFEIHTCSRITHGLSCVQKFLQLWELNGKTSYEKIRQSYASPSATPPTRVTCNRALSWFWFPLQHLQQLF